ncbi:hypothetical protein ABSA28_01111 [Candidatus Hepatincolaceae symbiont of Richtersius coronifer]
MKNYRFSIFFPSLAILLGLTLQLFFTSYNNYLFFSLNYTLIYFLIFMYPKTTPLPLIFLNGVVTDAINDITLGVSPLIFMLAAIFISLQIKYVKNKDFFSCYKFFLINTIILGLIIVFLDLFYDMSFNGIWQFILFSMVFLPLIFYLVKITFSYTKNQHE